MPMDIPKLLRSLNEHSARFVVIGATAFPIHGYARATLDIDIFIEPTKENARRVHEALRDFGYDVTARSKALRPSSPASINSSR